jgi:hypothetical protein
MILAPASIFNEFARLKSLFSGSGGNEVGRVPERNYNPSGNEAIAE